MSKGALPVKTEMQNFNQQAKADCYAIATTSEYVKKPPL